MVKQVRQEEIDTLDQRISEVKRVLTECIEAMDSRVTEIEGKAGEQEERVKALEKKSGWDRQNNYGKNTFPMSSEP